MANQCARDHFEPSRGAFDPRALEMRFSGLDTLGPRLWLPAIVNTEAGLVERIAALPRWRERLLAGTSPVRPDDHWPSAAVVRAFDAVIIRLELPLLSRRHEEVTDQLIRSLLWHIDRIAMALMHLAPQAAVTAAADAFFADWDQPRCDMKEILRVFESLDGIANFARWSELQGLLQDESWRNVVAAHEILAGLPNLAAMIRALGRARPTEEIEIRAGAVEQVESSQLQWVRRLAEAQLPGAAQETEGIRRSGDLNRLLSSEAIMYRGRGTATHRRRGRLKQLFAARLYEHSLLTYKQREHWVEATWVPETVRTMRERPMRRPRLESGPIIACVDTSASMAGGPEAVAKAIVLEAMRTAARERRDCLLIAFSGPGDVRELELGADLDGIRSLAEFLKGSFHGGTDIVEPVERAIRLVESARWRNADLLIASDGEFGPTPSLAEHLERVKRDTGLRVQGALIGDRETMGLRKTCDDIFWVREWRRYGQRHAQETPPVHDRNLTGLYFPNASAAPGSPASDSGAS